MLDKEFKKNWLEGLRSDKYKQGTCNLKDNYEEACYCALGVGLAENGYQFDEKDGNHIMKDGKSISGYYILKEVGLGRKVIENIYKMNDRTKLPFKEIAKYVSRNVKAK